MNHVLVELACLVITNVCSLCLGYLIGKPPRDLNLEKERQPFGIIRGIDAERAEAQAQQNSPKDRDAL